MVTQLEYKEGMLISQSNFRKRKSVIKDKELFDNELENKVYSSLENEVINGFDEKLFPKIKSEKRMVSGMGKHLSTR